MTHIMLDLETLSTKPDSLILSIGAVEFDPNIYELGYEFHTVVDWTDAKDLTEAFSVDTDTVRWWLSQSDVARGVFAERGHCIVGALERFTEFCDQVAPDGKPVIWGNGANFDNVILRNAYATMEMPTPWSPFNDRCYRTLKNLYPNVKAGERVGVHHSALDDAKHQALHAMTLLRHASRNPYDLAA